MPKTTYSPDEQRYIVARRQLVEDLANAVEPSRSFDRRIDFFMTFGADMIRHYLDDPEYMSPEFNYVSQVEEAAHLLPDFDHCSYSITQGLIRLRRDRKKLCNAIVNMHDAATPSLFTQYTSYGATPALALTIAALRARGWAKKILWLPKPGATRQRANP